MSVSHAFKTMLGHVPNGLAVAILALILFFYFGERNVLENWDALAEIGMTKSLENAGVCIDDSVLRFYFGTR